MNSMQLNVLNFMKKFDQYHNDTLETVPDDSAVNLGLDLIKEEFHELYRALENPLLICEIADAITDLIYVCFWLANVYGFPMQELFDEVHKANMKKEKHPLGGKVRKPSGWEPPDISGVLFNDK